MMMLGVVIHTALVFMPDAPWIYQDPQRSDLAGLMVLLIHVFRMPIFFVMAGFFGAMLQARKGAMVLGGNRFNRIVVPLVVGWFVLFPMLSWSISFGWTYAMLPEGERSIMLAFQKMGVGVDFKEAGPMHLWFLYYLLYYYIACSFLSWLLGRFARPVVDLFNKCLKHFIIGRLRLLRLPLLVIASFLLMIPMKDPGVDTPESWIPVPRILLVYAFYFWIGWITYRHREVIEQLKNWSWLRLLGGLLMLGLCLIMSITWYMLLEEAGVSQETRDWILAVAQLFNVTCVWLLVLGLTGVTERLLSRENPLIRYMVDASYWIYLMHLPLTLFIPALFRYWDIDGTLKMLIMMVLVTVPLIVTYHLFVRGSVIGVVLNGRRYPTWFGSHHGDS